MTASPHASTVQRAPVAARRALWSVLDAIATPASALATLAALVRALGASDYGVLVIAMAASGVCLAINPAIAATTTKFVSELSGRPGRQTVAGVISVALLAVAAIDVTLLLGTALFTRHLRGWLFGAASVDTPHLGLVLWLAVLSMALQQIETVLGGAIRGLERFRRQAAIELLSRATLTVAVIYVAWQSRSLVLILGAQCVVFCISMLVRALALRRVLPHQRLFARPTLAEAGLLIRYGGWMGLTALAGVVYASVDRIIIGRVLGTVAAGAYNIDLQITQLIHFVPASLFAFALPLFSRLAAQETVPYREIGRTFRAYMLGIASTALIVSAAITVSWPLMLSLFAGSNFAAGRSGVVILLILNFLLLACNVGPYYLLIALGQARTVAVITSISTLAALILMAVLIPRYGLFGAAVSRLAYGVGSMMLLPRALRTLKHDAGTGHAL